MPSKKVVKGWAVLEEDGSIARFNDDLDIYSRKSEAQHNASFGALRIAEVEISYEVPDGE